MNNCDHEQLNTRRRKSREVSSRFLSPSSSSSLSRRNSTSNSSTKRENCLLDNHSSNGSKVHLGLRKYEQMSDGRRVSFGFPNQRTSIDSSGMEVDSVNTKENGRPSPWIDDEDYVILPGRFSVDESALYRSSSRRNSCSLLSDLYNNESDSELSDVSFASSLSTNCSFRKHKPGIKVSSKYMRESREKPNSMTKLRSKEDSEKAKSFRGNESVMKRPNPMARYGSSMSQWALSPGRSGSPLLSLETQAVTVPSSKLKPPLVGSLPRSKGVGKLLNLGFDFFRGKKKSSSVSSPLKPNPCDAEAVHQLKLMKNRLVQWRFVNARACVANNNVAAEEKKQLICAWDTLTKLKQLVLQERIKLQKKYLEMKLNHVLMSQIKHLEAWEDIEIQHLSALSMIRQCLHYAVSRLPLREGAKVNMESTVTLFHRVEAVTVAIISALANVAPSMEGIVPLVSQLAQVTAQEKLMLEECHDLLRMMSESELQERSLKCCFLIQHKQTSNTKLVND